MGVTNAIGQSAAGDPSSAPGKTSPPAHFLTHEYLLAHEISSHAAFCREQCRLCRAFVRRLGTPIEFQSLKSFFPFHRLASVIEFPRTHQNLSTWIQLAFQAGRELGQAQPGAAEKILPDHVLCKSRESLISVQRLAGDEALTADGLARVFDRLVDLQWPEINPVEIDQVYCETAIRALRAGFMAATVALVDPSLGTFCEDLPCIPLEDKDVAEHALIGACVFEWDADLPYRMEHPLLRLARQFHQHDLQAQEALRSRVESLLLLTGVRSENEDPCCFLGLADTSDGADPESEAIAYRGRQLEFMLRKLDREVSANPASHG